MISAAELQTSATVSSRTQGGWVTYRCMVRLAQLIEPDVKHEVGLRQRGLLKLSLSISPLT